MDTTTGNLDRKAGFTAVDTAFAGNFFGTTKSTGAAYLPGDSRADVAGNLPTVGFAPHGADGTIDQTDIDYVKAQFINNAFVTDGQATWSDTAEAVGFDLSADINGDLVVDGADVVEILKILGACSQADINFDGVVNTIDVLTFLNEWNAGSSNADVNFDGSINTIDVLTFLNIWNAGC